MNKITNNERATYKLAVAFGKGLKKGDIVLLKGDLGSGKTVFAKGIAKALKVKVPVTSPTFTIYNLYQGKNVELYHFDMYRLSSCEEALAIGVDEIIASDAIKLIEWPDIIQEIIGEHYYLVDITKIDDEKRQIVITRY